MYPSDRQYSKEEVLINLRLLADVRTRTANLQLNQKRQIAGFLKLCIGNIKLNELFHVMTREYIQPNIQENNEDRIARLELNTDLNNLIIFSFRTACYHSNKIVTVQNKCEHALEAFNYQAQLNDSEKLTLFEIKILADLSYAKDVLQLYKEIFGEVDPYLEDMYSKLEKCNLLTTELERIIYNKLDDNGMFDAGTISIADSSKNKIIVNISKSCFQTVKQMLNYIHVYAWCGDSNGDATIGIFRQDHGSFVKDNAPKYRNLARLLATDHYQLSISTLLSDMYREYRYGPGLYELQERYARVFNMVSYYISLIEEGLDKKDQTRATIFNGVINTLQNRVDRSCIGPPHLPSPNRFCYGLSAIAIQLKVSLVCMPVGIYFVYRNCKLSINRLFVKSKIKIICEKIMTNPERINEILSELITEEDGKVMLCSEFIAWAILTSLSLLYGNLIIENQELRAFLHAKNEKIFPIDNKADMKILTPNDLKLHMDKFWVKKPINEAILKVIDIDGNKVDLEMTPEPESIWLRQYLEKFCYEKMQSIVMRHIEERRFNEACNIEGIRESCKLELEIELNRYINKTGINPQIDENELRTIINKCNTRIIAFILNVMPRDQVTADIINYPNVANRLQLQANIDNIAEPPRREPGYGCAIF